MSIINISEERSEAKEFVELAKMFQGLKVKSSVCLGSQPVLLEGLESMSPY